MEMPPKKPLRDFHVNQTRRRLLPHREQRFVPVEAGAEKRLVVAQRSLKARLMVGGTVFSLPPHRPNPSA